MSDPYTGVRPLQCRNGDDPSEPLKSMDFSSRLFPLAGMLGSGLFVTVFTVEGWLRPGYSARQMFVSELSLGPRGWVQIANFMTTGVLLLIFALWVRAAFLRRRWSVVGPFLLALTALGLLLSGPLVMDPASTPRAAMTLHSRLHWTIGGLFVFLLVPVTCVVFYRSFTHRPGWASFRVWTLAEALLTGAVLVTFSVGPTRPPAPPGPWNVWNGALQRAILVPYMVWLFTLALRLRRRG